MPVVFIHGFLCSSWAFKAQVDYFSSKYRAIAIDHLGHGKSDKPEDEDYSLADLANYLEEVLQELVKDEQIVLAGHSMGGMIAQIYATTTRLSKRLKGLILMSTAPKLQNPGLIKYVEQIDAGNLKIVDRGSIKNTLVNFCFYRTFIKTHPEIIKEYIDICMENEEFVGSKTMHAIVLDYNVEEKIKNINVPTLILVGDKDAFISPTESALMDDLILKSKLVKLAPKVGHMIQFEAKEDYHKAVSEFLEGL